MKFDKIREPQVVLSPRVTMTSFRARGMPVSGVASPRARSGANRLMLRLYKGSAIQNTLGFLPKTEN